MATRKRANSKRGPSVEPERAQAAQPSTNPPASNVPASQISKIPENFRLPLLVTSSLFLSYVLYSFAAPYTSGDLATVSGHRDRVHEIVFFLLWRAVELSVGWYEGFDTADQASLTFLAHLPYLFFLTAFYKIRPTTALICLFVDLLAISIPFYFLRKSSVAHQFQPPDNSVANRSVISDWSIQVLTTLLSSGVYASLVEISFRTWAPRFFVTHFEGIKDLSKVYNPQFLLLYAAFLPVGFAARAFLFNPSTAAKPDAYDERVAAFDPETATLGETFIQNIFGHSIGTRILTRRTLTLAAVVGIHTWLHTYLVVDGAEGFGAIGWSSIWVLSAIITGLGFGWVENVSY